MKLGRVVFAAVVALGGCRAEPEDPNKSVSNRLASEAAPADIVCDAVTIGPNGELRCTPKVTPTPTPSPSPTTTPTPSPSPTATPTPTPSPSPTATPTPTPSPTATPTPSPTPTPGNVPAIPQKPKWESNMALWGQKNCDYQKSVQGGTVDQRLGSTYYDGEKVYLQIGTYTKSSFWPPCASLNEQYYRDLYVIPNNGGVPGYWNFSNGMALDWKATGDVKSKDAINMLALHASYCAQGTEIPWTANASMSREVSYCIRALDDSETVGFAHQARQDVLLGQVLNANGHIDQWVSGQALAPTSEFDGPAACMGQNYFQPFMAGITMTALIQVWERTHDVRIPPKIKALADFLWAQSYDPVKKAFWYENCSAPGTFNWTQSKSGAPDLNLMIAPAFAWLWKYTGDDKYRVEGDSLFEGGVLGAYIEQPKQFHQNYTDSFKYVLWRSSPPTPMTFASVSGMMRTRVVAVPFPSNLPKEMRPSTKLFPEKR